MQISVWSTWQSANGWPIFSPRARLLNGTIELQRRRGLTRCLVGFLGVIAGCGAFGFARRTLGMNHFRHTYFQLLWCVSWNVWVTLCILILKVESGVKLLCWYNCAWFLRVLGKKELPPRPKGGWTLYSKAMKLVWMCTYEGCRERERGGIHTHREREMARKVILKIRMAFY